MLVISFSDYAKFQSCFETMQEAGQIVLERDWEHSVFIVHYWEVAAQRRLEKAGIPYRMKVTFEQMKR